MGICSGKRDGRIRIEGKLRLPDKFCYWQVVCKDDFNEDEEQISWTCTAHLHEARAFPCPYDSLKEAKEQRYPCMDAKPPEEVKE